MLEQICSDSQKEIVGSKLFIFPLQNYWSLYILWRRTWLCVTRLPCMFFHLQISLYFSCVFFHFSHSPFIFCSYLHETDWICMVCCLACFKFSPIIPYITYYAHCGWHCMSQSSCCVGNVYLCLVVCDHTTERAHLSMRQEHGHWLRARCRWVERSGRYEEHTLCEQQQHRSFLQLLFNRPNCMQPVLEMCLFIQG